MTAFLAIVKLTFRSAIRSHIFRLLLFLLLLSIFLLPFTLLSDGTPKGEVQIFLQYCLGFAGTILCLSSVWLACSEVCGDVESAHLHMIVVKPVRRSVVLLGKYAGVALIHLVLLLIAAVAIYISLMIRLSYSDMSPEDRKILDEQVLTARSIYLPTHPDIDFKKEAQKELDHRIAQAKEHGQDIQTVYKNSHGIDNTIPDDQILEAVYREILDEMIKTNGLIEAGEYLDWEFKGLPKRLDANDRVYLRYTVYVNRYYTQSQTLIRGIWRFRENNRSNDKSISAERWIPDENLMPVEADILTAAQNEMQIPVSPDKFVRDGEAVVRFENWDTNTSEVNFEEGKGPFLLIREAGFFSNYCRAVLVLAIGIVSITLLASAIGACLSLPIALFLSASYLLAGSLASYTVTSIPDELNYQAEYTGTFGYRFGDLLLTVIVPIQDFFVTDSLANGELVGFQFIGLLFAKDFLLRTFPVFLLGAWLYTRRELALEAKRG